MGNRLGNNGKSDRLYFGGSPKSLHMVTVAMKLKDACLLLGRKAMTNLNSILESRTTTLLTKVHTVKAMVFPVLITDVRAGPQTKLSTKELMLLSCDAGEDS